MVDEEVTSPQITRLLEDLRKDWYLLKCYLLIHRSGPPSPLGKALRIRNLTDKSKFELKPKFRLLRSPFDRNSIHYLPRVLPAKRVQALACTINQNLNLNRSSVCCGRRFHDCTLR